MIKINKEYVELMNKYLNYLDTNIEKAKNKKDEALIGTPELVFWENRLDNLVLAKTDIENNLENINLKLEEAVLYLTTSIDID